MRLSPSLLPLIAIAVVATGCPAPKGNQLWIAPGGGTAALRLVDREPSPF
jgi:hypothetical protein